MLEPSDRKVLTNVTRWFTTCTNQPQFLKVLGAITLCEKMVPVTPKPNAAESPKVAASPKATANPKAAGSPKAAPASPAVESAEAEANGEEVLCHRFFFVSEQYSDVVMFPPSGPPKTEAQLKKDAKKREKLEKFQQKKDTEEKKKTLPQTEVSIVNFYNLNLL